MHRLDSKIVITLFGGIFLVAFSFFSPENPVFKSSTQFLLGVNSFSLTDGAPHAPGAYFYVLLLRAASILAGSALGGMLLINRLFALFALWGMYRSARFLHGRFAGLFAALLFMFHPFMLSSAVGGDPAFAVVAIYVICAYLGIRTIRDPDPVGFFRFSLAVTVLAGFSFSAFVSMLPLFIVLVFRANERGEPLAASVSVITVGTLLWLLPAIASAGSFSGLLRLSIGNFPEYGGSIQLFAAEIFKASFYGIGVHVVGLMLLLKKTAEAYGGRLLRHSVLLIVPLLLVLVAQMALGHYPTALLLLPVPLMIFGSVSGAMLFEPEISVTGMRKYSLLGLLTVLPCVIFLFIPSSLNSKERDTNVQFVSEQWTISYISQKNREIDWFVQNSERLFSQNCDSSFILFSSQGVPDARSAAFLMYPAEVFSQLADGDIVYYHKHRRFPLTGARVDMGKRMCLFVGDTVATTKYAAVKKVCQLSDGRFVSVIQPLEPAELRHEGSRWVVVGEGE